MPSSDKAKFAWRINQYCDGVKREFAKRTARAAALVRQQVKRNISTSSRTAGPSKSGEYPHLDTGLLRNSIEIKVDQEKLRGWVFTNTIYGLFLEYGTTSKHGGTLISGRSFLRRTLREMRPQIKQIYQAPLPGGLAGGGKLIIGHSA